MSEVLTIVATVSTIFERDQLVKRIYTNLTKEPQTTFIVQQDQVNRIKVFHRVGPGIQVLVRMYLVIIIPIGVNLSPLKDLRGVINFHLDDTISRLRSVIAELEAMQGRKIMKGESNEQTLTQLVGSLSESYG